jgi:hypothetical protein
MHALTDSSNLPRHFEQHREICPICIRCKPVLLECSSLAIAIICIRTSSTLLYNDSPPRRSSSDKLWAGLNAERRRSRIIHQCLPPSPYHVPQSGSLFRSHRPNPFALPHILGRAFRLLAVISPLADFMLFPELHPPSWERLITLDIVNEWDGSWTCRRNCSCSEDVRFAVVNVESEAAEN